MDIMFLLYLIGQADAIVALFGISTIVLLIFSGILFIIRCVLADETESEKTYNFVVKCMKFTIPTVIVCAILAAFVPNSNTMKGMAAGEIVLQAAKLPEVQSIAGNSVKLLDNYLKELVDKKQEKN